MKKIVIALFLFFNPVLLVGQNIYAEQDANSKLWGFKKDGMWIVEPVYAKAFWSRDHNLGEVKKTEDGMCAIVNQEGNILTDFEYTSAISGEVFEDGPTVSNMIFVHKEKDGTTLQGIIDRKGKVIIPCIYEGVVAFEHTSLGKGIAVKTIDNKNGLFDLEGNILIEVKYANHISPYAFSSSTYVMVNEGGKCEGNSVLCGNPIGGKWGVVGMKGNEIVPCDYDGIKVAYEGNDRTVIFAVNKGGYRDSNGNTIGGKWGLYANGKEIVACQFDNAPEFKNDVATVKINGQVKLLKNPLKDGSQIQIASGDKSSDKKGKGPVVSRYPAPDSDVDKNIPTAKVSADNTFAFIIANENYPDAPVPYSLNDGRMFKEYCQKALGLPEKNINLYEDATFGNIITAVEKMKQIADAYDGDASVIFYYAGHGFPDEKQSTAYLLPIDGNASDITTTGYSLAKLYKELSELKLKSSIVFLDACFSGTKREDQMLSESRGVAIKVKEEAPKGNMLVFSAAQGDETAHQMEEKHHGLFTYYLLKELQATGGDVDMGTLTEYVTKQVKRQSVVMNNKKQTPTVIPSQSLMNSWQTMKLK